ncbi:hypothetical protein EXU85_17825 [Spirosoma sp. KCTC 42546]|uniref:hypothetical protein n=1 Tax=Spirosoma sp. KCTC 42546 TaxID=2520506 RepID=UPI001157F564|nr:hypothetical protein [Spirosoma sp. KCTC 42546]QDK80359.1 hypothetical protein EXU85_17825 [Spirosoma sp. KCTC 42546]
MKSILSLIFIAFQLIFSILIVPCKANPYREGYIVNNQSDTLYGLIDYKFTKTQQQCFFKKQISSEPKVIYPDDVKSFTINNDKTYYVIDMPLSEGKKKVFAELLISGKATLYKYSNIFFAQKDTSAIIPLLIVQQESYKDGQHYSITDKKYYNDLKYYLMADCGNIDSLLLGNSLRQDILIKLFESYNRCVGSTSYIPQKHLPWLQIERYLYIGGSTNFIKFSNLEERYDYLVKQNYNFSISPTIGVQFFVRYPRLNKKIGFQTGLFMEYQNFNGKYTSNRLNSGDYPDRYSFISYIPTSEVIKYFPVFPRVQYYYTYKSEVNIRYWHFKIPVLFRVQAPDSKTTGYYGTAGLNANINIYSKNQADYMLQVENASTGTYSTAAFIPRLITVSLSGSAGVQRMLAHKHKIVAEVKIEQSLSGPWAKSNAVQEYVDNKSSMLSAGILVGYSF